MRLSAARSDSVRFAPFGSVWFDSVRLGPVLPGSARSGSVRLARFCSVQLGVGRGYTARPAQDEVEHKSGSTQTRSHLLPDTFETSLPVPISSPELRQHPLVPNSPVSCTGQLPKVSIDALVQPGAPKCRGTHTANPINHMLKTMMLWPHRYAQVHADRKVSVALSMELLRATTPHLRCN